MRELSDYIPTGVNPGGKTPSFQAKLGSDLSQRYQIKRSNFIKIFRKMIGLDSDQSDILGEYIASKVIAELLNEKSQDPSVKSPPDLAPEVNLVYDKEFDDFCIASKYLNDGDKNFKGMTFGEFINKKDETANNENPKEQSEVRRKKTKLVFGDASDNQLSIDKTFDIKVDDEIKKVKINKADLYNALTSSIILGDHDINPNNFYAIYEKDNNELRVGRIDLGHAFNDLIKNWMVGTNTPNINSSRGGVLDFLNRKKENGGQTKFNRHFDRNIVLDPDFAKSLKNQSKDIGDALFNCEEELRELMDKSPKVRNQLVKSAKTLQKRMGAATELFDKALNLVGNIPNKALRNVLSGFILPFRRIFDLTFFLVKKLFNIPKKIVMIIPIVKIYFEKKQRAKDEKLIKSLVENCREHIAENRSESASVANLIEIQIIIKNLLEKDSCTDVEIKEATDKIKGIYESDKRYLKGKSFNDQVEWVNQSESTKPLNISLNQYIKEHGDKLGKNQLVEKINKSLNEKSQVPKSLSEKLQVSNNRTKQWSSQITHNTNRIAPNNISHSISFSDKSKQSNNKKGRL